MNITETKKETFDNKTIWKGFKRMNVLFLMSHMFSDM